MSRNKNLPFCPDRPLIMGILNLTQDSFSDGGDFYDVDASLARAQQMERDGADIIDVGAESTRPNAKPISANQEAEILIPRIKLLREVVSVPISVDTYKPSVARAAIEAGADIINDVYCHRDSSGFAMARTAAELGCWLILTLDSREEKKVSAENFWESTMVKMRDLLSSAENEGVSRERVILDAGVGFGKTVEENFEIVRKMGELKSLGLPTLLGVSRKSMFAEMCADDFSLRDVATAVVSACVARENSVDILRVHNVAANRVAIQTGKILRNK